MLTNPFMLLLVLIGLMLFCIAYHSFVKRDFRVIGTIIGAFGLLFVAAGGGLGIPVVLNNTQLGWLSTTQTLPVWRLGFYSPGDAGQPVLYVGSNSACSLNSGNGNGGSQVKSDNNMCWLAAFPDYVSVLQFGADPTGVIDSMPAIRAATNISTIKNIIIPPGLYSCQSLESAVLPAFDDACVRIHDRNDLTIIADGARFLTNNASAYSSIFSVETVNNFHWRGGEFIGNRTGLGSSLVNSAFALNSLVDFSIENVRLTGNWGGNSDFAYGDWLVNGYINNISIEKAGQCVDFAFIKGVTLSNFRAKGADANGNQGVGQIGLKCLSFVNDVLLLGANHTGQTFPNTAADGIMILNNDISNFGVGIYLTSGQHYTLTGNYVHDNPGTVSVAGGLGLFVGYVNGGNFTSVGKPPGNVISHGNIYANNGAAQPGAGVLISTSTITNSDIISNISIDDIFDNNSSQGVESDSFNHISSINIRGVFSGTNQTVGIGGNMAAVNGTASTIVTQRDTTGGTQTHSNHVQLGGHLVAHGNPPTFGAGCGTGAAFAPGSGDLAGGYTTGSSPGGTCEIIFNKPFASQPVCRAYNITAGIQPGISRTTTQLFVVSGTVGQFIEWTCIGYQ
jgi:hypothetical protein